MFENKIIRNSILIDNRKSIKYARYLIKMCKEDARKKAKSLKLPKNSHKYEVFDVRFVGFQNYIVERPLKSVKEMMVEASVLGCFAYYNFVIDGEYDKKGNKI